MPKPTKTDFETAHKVLEFMLASTDAHEPFAFNDIRTMEKVLQELSFDPSDYPEVD